MSRATARHDADAEAYVLGAVLLSEGRVLEDEDVAALVPEDFYRPIHEALWRRVRTMHAKGEPVEPMAVGATLDGDPIRGVNLGTLHTIVEQCVTPANAGYYAKRLKALAKYRRMASAGVAIIQATEDTPAEDVETVAALTRSAVDDALADVVTGRAADLGVLVDDATWRYGEPEAGLVPTGLIDLDKALSRGLRPGHLMVIGARPAVGKSFVATTIASHVAGRGTGVFFASLEMTSGEVVDRILSDVANVALTRLTERDLGMEDWPKIAQVRAALADMPLVIDDKPDATVGHIRAHVRAASRRAPGGIRVVIVDYLQLVTPDNIRLPRHEQVGAISRGLKLMARELGVTVIALAQVNRGSAARADKKPIMSDLRESGAIEADADEIILLHREEKRGGEIDFIIEKNRHGTTGTLTMAWLPRFARIASLARRS